MLNDSGQRVGAVQCRCALRATCQVVSYGWFREAPNCQILTNLNIDVIESVALYKVAILFTNILTGIVTSYSGLSLKTAEFDESG